MTPLANTAVHVDTKRPFAALELPEKEKFTGKNHPAFIRNISIVFRYLKILYLIDGTAQKKPNHAVEENDTELLYMCLHRNLDENGKDLIAEHSGDGVKAWRAFNKRFGQADTGTTMDKFWEHISTRWEGGDSESFIELVAKWDAARRELRNRDIKLEDWIDALLLMAMVPREFTSKLKDSELQDWKKLKRENVIDRIQAYISAQGKESGAAFYARQNGSSNKNRSANNSTNNINNHGNNNKPHDGKPLTPCSICKHKLKLPEDKCKHAEERCFNKEKFATLLKSVEQNQDASAIIRPFSAMAVEASDTLEMEASYLAVDAESALLARIQTDHWIVDTGCTSSMTFSRELMHDYEIVVNKSVRVGNNNHALAIMGKGKLMVDPTDHHGNQQRMTLHNVLHIPRIVCNLLSVTELLDEGSKIVLSEDKLDILHHDGFTFGTARKNGLYTIQLNVIDCPSSRSAETCFVTDALLLHRRFGHADLSKIASAEYPDTRVKDCDACIRGKFRRLPFNGSNPPVTEPLAQINADLFGLTRVATHTGAKYLCVFIDAATGYVKVCHLKAKVKPLIASNLSDVGWRTKRNALAERRIGIILNDARTLLLDSGLPAKFWGYATAHAVYLRNRIPRNGNAVSSHEALLRRRPRTDHSRPSGCAAYTWIPPTQQGLGKLDARAELTTFLGFEEGTSNCLLTDKDSGRFFRARDVRFVESYMPALGEEVPDLSFLDVQWEKGIEEHQENSRNHIDKTDEPEEETTTTTITHLNPAPDRREHETPPPTSPIASRTRDAIRQRTLLLQEPVIHAEPPQAPDDDSDDEMGLVVTSLETPLSMTDALNGPDAAGWKESLQKKLDSIEQAETWDLIDKADVPIDSRLVLATKIDPSGGNDHKLKTRLCAKGFTQRHGIDYFETFSPVGHRQSFRLLLSITASLDLEIEGLDITTAFLHGPLEETIYMRLPHEITIGQGSLQS